MRKDQRFGARASTHPNQSPGGDGLTRYVADRASVDGRDVVVWYTAGLTHHPVIEDFPVMNRESVGFSLRPDGFFDENPALDVPEGGASERGRPLVTRGTGSN